MTNPLAGISLGCSGRGVAPLATTDVDTLFRMVKASGVFDHYDRFPQPGQERAFIDAALRHDLPIRTGSVVYRAGANLVDLAGNLRIAKTAGGEFHNVLLNTTDAHGRELDNDEVARIYLQAHELGEQIGIGVGFEVHIDMWSENFPRVAQVRALVEQQGVPFRLVLDHSHVLLKLDCPEEQDASGIREAVERGELILDPFERGHIVGSWLTADIVPWLQVRTVAPGGPKNRWAQRYGGGGWGRACQYPFLRPQPGEWHSPWSAHRLEPSKEVVRQALRHHVTHANSPLRFITTEMIDMPDYGDGARYSLFEHNVAIARWVRDEAARQALLARHAATGERLAA